MRTRLYEHVPTSHRLTGVALKSVFVSGKVTVIDMGLFGGGCGNNGGGFDSWIWIIIIVVLVLLCCDGNIFGSSGNDCCDPCCDPCCKKDPCRRDDCC